MVDASAELDAIDRIHDAEPEEAAARLRALDTAALPADGLGTATFLLAHVIGERIGRWDEAAQRIDTALRGRDDAPVRALRNAAVAQRRAGDAKRAADWETRLAQAAGAPVEVARLTVDVHALAFTGAAGDMDGFAAALLAATRTLARPGAPLPASCGLDAALGAGFNNATSALLDACADGPIDEPIASALRAGAETARAFWLRAGTWVNHERADYLLACVLNRIGDHKAARTAALRGLDVITAHGKEDVDRAFLLLQLAGALRQAGDSAAAAAARASADKLAAQLDDESLRTWFAAERDRLLAAAPARGTAQ